MAWAAKVFVPAFNYALIFSLPLSIAGVVAGFFGGGCCAGGDSSLQRLSMFLIPPLALIRWSEWNLSAADPSGGLFSLLFLNLVFYFLFFTVLFSLLNIDVLLGFRSRKRWQEFCPYCGEPLEEIQRSRCSKCGAIVSVDPGPATDD